MKKKQTYKRTIAQKPTQVQIKPGADVGGEDKIFGIFPNPLKAAKKVIDIVNPFNIIKTTGEDLGKTDYFGPILAITSKMILGQQPDQMDYKNVGLGLNLLIAKGVQDGQLKGGIIPAFAEGGLVDPDVLSAVETGGDISSWVSNVFRGEIETGAQKTMRLIKENMAKKKAETDASSGDDDSGVDGGGSGGGGSLTAGQWGPILDLIASKESGGSYTKMYGGKENPSLINMTLQEVSTFQAAHAKKTGSAAMGRYQFMNALGQGAAVGLKPTDKFSPENQDKMAVGLIVQKRKVTLDMIKSNPDEAMIRLGMEWAAIGMPKAMKGHRRMVAAGETYYAGDGVNKAHITPEQMREAFAKTVGGGYSQAEIAKSQAGSSAPGMSVSTSAASGPAGNLQKNAGDLGSFIKSLGVAKGSGVHEHPQHGGIKHQHRGKGHGEGRAIDIGGWGGRYGKAKLGKNFVDDQSAILAGINKFAQKTGKKPSLVLHGDNDPGHWDHVHAEYAKGGETLDGPHLAMLGEKGKEIVIDADSAGPAKDMLLAINQAKGYKGVMAAISQYAPYDAMSPQTIIIPTPSAPEEDDDYGSDGGGGGMLIASGGGDADPFSTLYQGG
jgi:muramidase (phage lysozyme)